MQRQRQGGRKGVSSAVGHVPVRWAGRFAAPGVLSAGLLLLLVAKCRACESSMLHSPGLASTARPRPTCGCQLSVVTVPAVGALSHTIHALPSDLWQTGKEVM